jgi:anaerobic selenocysteine-containing dehydrogenase
VLRGLARDDLFTVVHEQVLTDTCRWADVVLPATAFLEHREVRRGYGVMRLFDSPAVATPPGEAWSNHQLFARAARRGSGSIARAIRAPRTRWSTRSSPAIATAAARAARGRRRRDAAPTAPILFVDVFPAPPTARSTCAPAALDAAGAAGLYHYQPDPATAAFRWR